MIKKDTDGKLQQQFKVFTEPVADKEKNDLPIYPANEDIYYAAEEEQDTDPEDISKTKTSNDDESGNDLDVPGSELDNDQESIGSEDEENNYYSIGGDDHNDLEEDKGE